LIPTRLHTQVSAPAHPGARAVRTVHAGRSDRIALEEAHRSLKISPEEFDEVAAELGRTLDFVNVPHKGKGEVLAAFAAHNGEVTEGYAASTARR